MLNDLIAGHADLTFIQYSAFYDLHKAGAPRSWPLPRRPGRALPDIPTMAEMGFPDIVANTWNMMSAPRARRCPCSPSSTASSTKFCRKRT